MTRQMHPATMTIDGVEWIEKWAYDEARKALLEKQRSKASHGHQFAAINDMFDNLPISHAGAPYAASKEAFRKHGLIATGHCDVSTIDCESHELACRVAKSIANAERAAHGYALVIARGPLVIASTPHSQSYQAMGKDLFNKSKADVLAWAETMLGVQSS